MVDCKANNRIETIELLRAFGIIAVLIFHFFPQYLKGGYLGVDLFYVISGFVITSSLIRLREYDFVGYRTFIIRRFWRLYPSLVVIVALTTLLFVFIYPPGLRSNLLKGSGSTLLFFSNIYFGTNAGYFDIVSELMPLLHTWSLSIEWQFYFLIPILYLATSKNSNRCIILIVLTVASFFVANILSTTRPTLNFFGLQSRIWEFGVGALAYHFFYFIDRRESIFRVYHVVAILLMIFLMLSYFVFVSDFYATPSVISLPFIIAGVVSIYIGAIHDATFAKYIPSCLKYIGGISYSIYLVHYPFAAYAKYAEVNNEAKLLLILLTILISVLLSVNVESRYRYLSGSKVIYSLLCLSSIFAFTTFIYYSSDDADPQYANYVKTNFNNELLDNKTRQSISAFTHERTLVVGDSFAQDMANVLFEGGFLTKDSYDTFYISQQCGNLYVPRNDFYLENLPRSVRINCQDRETYNRIEDVLHMYKYVILASNWTEWQLGYVAESINNLRKKTDAKVVLVGVKGIGKVNPYIESTIPLEQRIRSYGSSPPYIQKINHELRSIVNDLSDNNVYFLDVNTLLCQTDNRCTKYTVDGQLISYDGGHLTRDGAIHLSKRIKIPF